MSIRIVTDSSADLPKALVQALQITVVPLTVNFGDERLLDGVDIDHDTFFRRLVGATIFPTTSQPMPGQFERAYADENDGDAIVSIHTAEEFSGTINVARVAARAFAGTRRIEVVDSRSTSMGMGLVVLEAARLARTGASVETVLAATTRHISRTRVCFTLESLEFLARGGRIGRAKRLLGTLLRIKPVLTIRDGVVEPMAQARTRAHAVATLARFAEEQAPLSALSVGYSTSRADAEALADRLAAVFSREAMLVTQAGPAIGTHVGPGFLSVAMLQREPDVARVDTPSSLR